MKQVIFIDLNKQEIKVQYSSLATENAIRVFINTGRDEDCIGIHLNVEQAHILIHALQDLINGYEQ